MRAHTRYESGAKIQKKLKRAKKERVEIAISSLLRRKIAHENDIFNDLKRFARARTFSATLPTPPTSASIASVASHERFFATVSTPPAPFENTIEDEMRSSSLLVFTFSLLIFTKGEVGKIKGELVRIKWELFQIKWEVVQIKWEVIRIKWEVVRTKRGVVRTKRDLEKAKSGLGHKKG